MRTFMVLLLTASLLPAASAEAGIFGFGRFGSFSGSRYSFYGGGVYSPGFARLGVVGPAYSPPVNYFSTPGIYVVPQYNYVLPPIHVPAELNYGPQAVKQFMGVDRNFALQPLQRSAPLIVNIPPQNDEPEPTNPETLAKAARFIEFGDGLFREQRFHDALQRYKSAGRLAPDMPAAFVRQGHALLATNRYDLAGEAFRKALSIDPGLAEENFRLHELYGDNRLAKSSVLDSLAASALANPQDENLMFLVGMFLHDDGQTERAQRFFLRAEELSADAEYLQGYLPQPQPEDQGVNFPGEP